MKQKRTWKVGKKGYQIIGQEYDGMEEKNPTKWNGTRQKKNRSNTLSTADTQCNATRCTLNTSDTRANKSASASEFENSIKLSKIHREHTRSHARPASFPLSAFQSLVVKQAWHFCCSSAMWERVFGDVFANKNRHIHTWMVQLNDL